MHTFLKFDNCIFLSEIIVYSMPIHRSHGALCACTAINMKGKLPRILHGGGKLSMRSRIQCIVKSTFSETRLVPGPMIKSLSFCAPSIR